MTSMRFITRLDYPQRSRGYWVRFQSRGVERTFKDSEYGSARRSLAAAVAWRDAQVKRLRVPTERKRTAAGHGYVRLGVARGRPAYVGWIKLDEHGRVGRTQWFIDTWGKRAAKQGAEAWLANKQSELKRARRRAA